MGDGSRGSPLYCAPVQSAVFLQAAVVAGLGVAVHGTVLVNSALTGTVISSSVVESFLWLHHLNGPGVDLEDSLHLIDGVPSGVKVSLHFTKIIYYKL